MKPALRTVGILVTATSAVYLAWYVLPQFQTNRGTNAAVDGDIVQTVDTGHMNGPLLVRLSPEVEVPTQTHVNEAFPLSVRFTISECQ
jgi:hypothetical protein